MPKRLFADGGTLKKVRKLQIHIQTSNTYGNRTPKQGQYTCYPLSQGMKHTGWRGIESRTFASIL